MPQPSLDLIRKELESTQPLPVLDMNAVRDELNTLGPAPKSPVSAFDMASQWLTPESGSPEEVSGLAQRIQAGGMQTPETGFWGEGLRPDGSRKGTGWLGPIELKDGRTASELSVGVEIDGKEQLIPSIVPGLDSRELRYIQEGGDPRQNPGIMDKAVEHAQAQWKQGKSAFAETAAPGQVPQIVGEGMIGSPQQIARPVPRQPGGLEAIQFTDQRAALYRHGPSPDARLRSMVTDIGAATGLEEIPKTVQALPEIVQAARQMPSPTASDISRKLSWLKTYVASLGGRIGPKDLREELLAEAEGFQGFGPAIAPAAGDIGTVALEWGLIYPKAFKLMGLTGKAISKIPQVAKAAEAIKAAGGLSKIAKDPRYARWLMGAEDALKSFAKGAGAGATVEGIESIGKEKSALELAKDITKHAATTGGVAAAFSIASSLDTKLYADRLRDELMRITRQRYDQRINGLPKGMADPAAKTLIMQERLEIQQIDDIVAGVEGQLRALKSGKMYKTGQEGVETPLEAANRIAKYGYKGKKIAPKGPPELKTGMGKRTPGDVIDMPKTRIGEAIEDIKGAIKDARIPERQVIQEPTAPPKPIRGQFPEPVVVRTPSGGPALRTAEQMAEEYAPQPPMLSMDEIAAELRATAGELPLPPMEDIREELKAPAPAESEGAPKRTEEPVTTAGLESEPFSRDERKALQSLGYRISEIARMDLAEGRRRIQDAREASEALQAPPEGREGVSDLAPDLQAPEAGAAPITEGTREEVDLYTTPLQDLTDDQIVALAQEMVEANAQAQADDDTAAIAASGGGPGAAEVRAALEAGDTARVVDLMKNRGFAKFWRGYKKYGKPVAGEAVAKQPWEMEADVYAESVGVPKPSAGFSAEMSGQQALMMSDRAKEEIRKKNSDARREQRKQYNDAVRKYEQIVRVAFESGDLRLSNAFDTDDFSTDAHIVVARILEAAGVDIDSPFRLRHRQDRTLYLRGKEREYWATVAAEGKPVPRAVLEDYAGEPWADEALAKLAPETPTVKESLSVEEGQQPRPEAAAQSVVTNQYIKPGDDRSRGATLTPSTRKKGAWQVTRFDVDGFFGDETYNTAEQAKAALQKEGYILAQTDLLAELSRTDRFREGNDKTVTVRMSNATDIPLDVVAQHRAPYGGAYEIYMTQAESEKGYPRALEKLRTWETDALRRERREMLKASFDRMFGHNAKVSMNLIDKVLEERTKLEAEGLQKGSSRPEAAAQAGQTAPAAEKKTISWGTPLKTDRGRIVDARQELKPGDYAIGSRYEGDRGASIYYAGKVKRVLKQAIYIETPDGPVVRVTEKLAKLTDEDGKILEARKAEATSPAPSTGPQTEAQPAKTTEKPPAAVVQRVEKPNPGRTQSDLEKMTFADMIRDDETEGVGKNKGTRYRTGKYTALDKNGEEYYYAVKSRSDGKTTVTKIRKTEAQLEWQVSDEYSKLPPEAHAVADKFDGLNPTQKLIVAQAAAGKGYDHSLAAVLGGKARQQFQEMFPGVTTTKEAKKKLMEMAKAKAASPAPAAAVQKRPQIPTSEDVSTQGETGPETPSTTPRTAEQAAPEAKTTEKPKPKNMAGQVRKPKPPKTVPPEFTALHPKSQEKFNAAWESRDATDMIALLDLSNRGLRAEFEKRSGTKLPKTVRGTQDVVNAYFAQPTEKPPQAAKTAEAAKEPPKGEIGQQAGPGATEEGIDAVTEIDGSKWEWRVATVKKGDDDAEPDFMGWWRVQVRRPGGKWESAVLGKKRIREGAVRALADHLAPVNRETVLALGNDTRIAYEREVQRLEQDQAKEAAEEAKRQAEAKAWEAKLNSNKQRVTDYLKIAKWKRQPVGITLETGGQGEPQTVPTHAGLAITKHIRGYRVTHIASGQGISKFYPSQGTAKEAAARILLDSGVDWTQDVKGINKTAPKWMSGFVSAIAKSPYEPFDAPGATKEAGVVSESGHGEIGQQAGPGATEGKGGEKDQGSGDQGGTIQTSIGAASDIGLDDALNRAAAKTKTTYVKQVNGQWINSAIPPSHGDYYVVKNGQARLVAGQKVYDKRPDAMAAARRVANDTKKPVYVLQEGKQWVLSREKPELKRAKTVWPKGPGLTRSESALYGAKKEKAISAQEMGKKVGYKAGQAVGLKEARRRVDALRMATKLTDKLRQEAVEVVQEYVPKEKQHLYIRRILNAKTDKRVDRIAEAVDAFVDREEKRQAVREFKKFIKDLKKKYRSGERVLGTLRNDVRSKVMGVLGRYDLAKLSQHKREILESRDEYIKRVAGTVADAFASLEDQGQHVIMMPDGRVEELRRLSQTHIGELDTDQIRYIHAALDHLVKNAERKGEISERIRSEKLDKLVNQASQEVFVKGKMGTERETVGVLGFVGKVLGAAQATPRTLVGWMTGQKNQATTQLITDNLYQGNNAKLGQARKFIEAVRKIFRERGIDNNVIRSLNDKVTISIGGQPLTTTLDNVLSIYMHIRAEGNLRRLLKTNGLDITTYSRNWRAAGVIKQKTISHVKAPSLGEVRDIANLIETKYPKLKEMAEAYFEFNHENAGPAINKTSMAYQNYELANRRRYWHVSRVMPMRVGGKSAKTGASIENQGRYQPRTGGTQRIRIIPFQQEFMASLQSDAAYCGMTMPMQEIRALVNSPEWQRAMIQAGHRAELEMLVDMLNRIEGMPSDQSFIEQAHAHVLHNFGKAALSLRLSGYGVQMASVPAAYEVIHPRYFAGLRNLKMIATAADIKEMTDLSDRLWMRWTGRQFDYVTGGVAAQHAMQTLILDHSPITDKLLGHYTKGDQNAIYMIYKAAQNKVAAETDLKRGTREFNAKAMEWVEAALDTQPQWDMIHRSEITSSPNVFVRGMTMFMSARNAQYNVMMRAIDDYRKGRIGGGEAGQRMAGVMLANFGVAAVKMMVRLGVRLGTLAAIYFLFTGDDEDEKGKVKRAATATATREAKKLPMDTVQNLMSLPAIASIVNNITYEALRQLQAVKNKTQAQVKLQNIRTGDIFSDLVLDMTGMAVETATMMQHLSEGSRFASGPDKGKLKWKRDAKAVSGLLGELVALKTGLPWSAPRGEVFYQVKAAQSTLSKQSTPRELIDDLANVLRMDGKTPVKGRESRVDALAAEYKALTGHAPSPAAIQHAQSLKKDRAKRSTTGNP